MQFDKTAAKGNIPHCSAGRESCSACTDAYLQTVRKAGAEYAGGKIREDTWDALREPLYPRAVYERMADARWGISAQAKQPPQAALQRKHDMRYLLLPWILL